MMSNEHLVNVPILVFANKVDLPNGMPVSELTEKLALHKLKQDWTIQPCCAVTREGLYEGLDWLKTHTRAVAIPK
jgi:signal recognition particle receptor subunit beta